ncbi:MAG: heat-inducible transcription repressor HrcA [Acidobacteria bacterium]|nr:heat-inducible transcription repressor HrcA [Acidobacteriota bacterium]
MARNAKAGELSEREKFILKSLIQEHIRTGRPVGSRRLSKLSREGLSPATVRNIVSDLEERRLLAQPHTSAGRVPTEMGYRFYVDSLVQTRELSVREAQQINEKLETGMATAQLMNTASQILSNHSSNIGFVLSQPISRAVLQYIEFVKLSEHRLLVVLVTQAGQVTHKLIQVDENLCPSELEQAGHYLISNFAGRTLFEVREAIVKLMREEKLLYDRLLKNAVFLASTSLSTLMQTDSRAGESEVYIGGTATLIQKTDLANVSRLLAVFQAFEEKGRLVKIITECIKTELEGPTVTIGLEHVPSMRDWALIASPYYCNNQFAGSLGILGPSRMEYSKAISLVDYMAKLFGRILSSN